MRYRFEWLIDALIEGGGIDAIIVGVLAGELNGQPLTLQRINGLVKLGERVGEDPRTGDRMFSVIAQQRANDVAQAERLLFFVFLEFGTVAGQPGHVPIGAKCHQRLHQQWHGHCARRLAGTNVDFSNQNPMAGSESKGAHFADFDRSPEQHRMGDRLLAAFLPNGGVGLVEVGPVELSALAELSLARVVDLYLQNRHRRCFRADAGL